MKVHNQLVPDAGVTILSLLLLHLMDLTVPVKRGMVAPMMISDCLENIMAYYGMKQANFDIVVNHPIRGSSQHSNQTSLQVQPSKYIFKVSHVTLIINTEKCLNMIL